MTLPVYRLRRILAATALLLTAVVVGMYFYARSQATNMLKAIPGKIGVDIKQTAHGFQFSKSDGKRTLFTIEASDLKQFKLNGRAELHNVNIVLYGRDSSRFDQIYGDDFAYDPATGDVTAKGDVQIDLVANPAGLGSPDQATPKELKNPIHLKTRDLIFNKETGNAWTDAKVEFQTSQAKGSAVGVRYAAKTNTLTLSSNLHLVLSGEHAAVIDAEHGVITNDPREVVLEHPHLDRQGELLQAERAVFYLGAENEVERIVASGNVSTAAKKEGASGETELNGRADQAEFLLTSKRDLLRTATLTGNVRFEQQGAQPMQGEAGRVIMDFAGQNQLQTVHALDGTHLLQKGTQTAAAGGSAAQDFELTAPAIDFKIAGGHFLDHAVTQGAALIVINSVPSSGSDAAKTPQKTVVTAGKFDAIFSTAEGKNHLASVHGAPDARIVSSTTGQPDRVSTSDSIDTAFLPHGGIAWITQTGNVAYTDQQTPERRVQAWANSARYTPADQMLALAGNPRISSGAMATTARSIRINRATGEAVAENEVKTTYSEVKEQPDGALLASASPIHVTARSMTAHGSGVATYSGNARLWQDANIIEAPGIQFDREKKFVSAQGDAAHPVQTILEQKQSAAAGAQKPGTKGRMTPISITAAQLTYSDAERKIRYSGGVTAHSADFTATAKQADAYLAPRSQTSKNQTVAAPGQLDRMVAQGDVVIQQPKRRAESQQMVYTAVEDKFVLTGGPPSIFDAEQGKITGVSLTFFRADDRVLVEGKASTPVVTTTRMAR